jgi:crotonobetainyl-CoA:carnitine CoA-transferase CaiB-like acyl-CoA transferase
MNSIFDGKLRVLDISMGWAGPLVGQMFAEMDAEVIKVEDTHHFDWWRGSLSMAPPEMQPIERAAVFNTANRGKRGVTLDLASVRGIEILKRLIEVSDILIENFSPGVMDRLGLAYEAVRAINPRLIMISMPSFGSDGPESNARGYGNTVEAMAGVTGLTGYHDGDGQRYTLSNALGDPVGGLHGVFALMVALRERERSGRGQLIESRASRVADSVRRRRDARFSVHWEGAGGARQPASRARASRNLPMRRRRQLDRARVRER